MCRGTGRGWRLCNSCSTLGRLWSFGIFSEGAAREGGGRSLSFGLSSANGVRCGVSQSEEAVIFEDSSFSREAAMPVVHDS